MVSGLLCKNGVGVFKCLSDYGIRCQRSHIASIVSVNMLLKNYGLPFKFQIKTRIDVYETSCPQQMLVHKGGKIKNWGGECRDVTPTKLLSQNIRVDVNREVKFL